MVTAGYLRGSWERTFSPESALNEFQQNSLRLGGGPLPAVSILASGHARPLRGPTK